MSDEEIGFAERAKRAIVGMLPERQIILRSRGETSYLTLSTGLQVAFIAGWVTVTGWAGFATIGYAVQHQLIAEKNDSIANSRIAYRKLLDQVSDYQLSVVGITRDLKETEAHLRRLFSQNEALREDLSSTEVALRTSEAERQRIAAARYGLGGQIELLGEELGRMSSKNDALEAHIGTLRAHLEMVEAEKAEIAAERSALDDRLWGLHNALETSSNKIATLETNVRTLKTDLRSVILERSAIAADNDGLRTQVVRLEDQIGVLKESHRAELKVIAERTLEQILTVEEVIKRTGLDVDDVAPLPEEQLMGQGGPFVPYHPEMESDTSGDGLRISLDRRLDRWRQLNEVYNALPLAAPMKDYRLSSRYGRRTDPFNKRLAMHHGLDFAAPYRSPVIAPGAGTVKFAAWRSRYGRTVEIDHGFGVMTRFAHLSKITVEKGQTVNVGDLIGKLGSSGRSTGPHLHYEVHYKGKTLNPLKFLRAARHVQQ
jgi:murein DD-endopeptidase MepM/ murein hydrolase activator NlpD